LTLNTASAYSSEPYLLFRIFLRCRRKKATAKKRKRKEGTGHFKRRPIYVKRGDVPQIYKYIIYRLCIDLDVRVSGSLCSLANYTTYKYL